MLVTDQCYEKMIPSLRYLCLEKVIAQDEDYSDLPRLLVRDINLMKVFNGTYTYSDPYETVQLKIFYDGKAWNFKSRAWYSGMSQARPHLEELLTALKLTFLKFRPWWAIFFPSEGCPQLNFFF